MSDMEHPEPFETLRLGLQTDPSAGYSESFLRALLAAYDDEKARVDAAMRRCRHANQVLVEAIGASGPDNVEEAACRAAERIAELEHQLIASNRLIEQQRERGAGR